MINLSIYINYYLSNQSQRIVSTNLAQTLDNVCTMTARLQADERTVFDTRIYLTKQKFSAAGKILNILKNTNCTVKA